MATRRGASSERTQTRTKIAAKRLERGLTQKEVAYFSGIPLTSYRRLERGQNPNPPLRWLVNCQHALALEDLRDVLEDDWLGFFQLGPGKPDQPPDPMIIRARR